MRRLARLGIGAVLVLGLLGCSSQTPGQDHNQSHDPGKQDARGRVGFPLAGPPPNGFAGKLDVGHVFSDGQLVIFNAGTEKLTLVKVEPEVSGHGLKYLGAMLAGPDRKIGFAQTSKGFPPTEPLLGSLVEARGAVLKPGRHQDKYGVELFLGFKVVAAGRTTVKSVKVTYRDSDGEHTGRWASTMAVCAPKHQRAPCPPEYDDS